MGKLLLGLAAGIVLTSTVFFLFISESEDSPSMAETLRSPLVDTTESRANGSPQSSTLADTEQANRVEQPAETVAANNATLDLTEDQLRNLPLEEVQAIGDSVQDGTLRSRALNEILRRQRIARWGNEPPPTHPITLPPEFGWLAENPDHLHEQLQREPVDPDWAAVTEAQIATFLSEHSEIVQKYGQPIVHCRTSGCELAFVAYGIEESAFQIMSDGKFFAVNEQPWADQFANSGATLFNAQTQGDATTILWHLIRE